MSRRDAEMWFTPTELHQRITRTLLLLGMTADRNAVVLMSTAKDERDALVTTGLVIVNEDRITALTDAGKQLIRRMMDSALDTVIGGMEPNCWDTVRIEPTGQIGKLIGHGNTTCVVELPTGEECEIRKRDCVLVQRGK